MAGNTPEPDLAGVPRLTGQLIELMGLLHSRMAGDAMQLMAELNLTMPQMVCLHILKNANTRSVGSIGGALSLSPSATSHLIDRLFERGIVTREEDPADRRQKLVSITPLGVEIVDRLSAARSDQISAAVADIDPELRAQLTDLVDLIIIQLRRGGPVVCPQS
ncbi:MarR family transcriptional regulator [Deltaproteobacteria bacterium]|nr:MarR family transcriptional regulator [Deltaproteobacteria bacterium]